MDGRLRVSQTMVAGSVSIEMLQNARTYLRACEHLQERPSYVVEAVPIDTFDGGWGEKGRKEERKKEADQTNRSNFLLL